MFIGVSESLSSVSGRVVVLAVLAARSSGVLGFFDGELTPYILRIVRDDGTLMDEGDLSDDAILRACKSSLQAAIDSYIVEVRPGFRPKGKIVLCCPNLLTAMYWQFAALVSGTREGPGVAETLPQGRSASCASKPAESRHPKLCPLPLR